MRISKQKNIRPTIIVAAIVILLIAIGGVTTWALTGGFRSDTAKKDGSRPENSVDYGNATDEQKQAGDKAKEDFVNKHESPSPSEQPTQSPLSSVSLTITSATQRDDLLQIRLIIETTLANGTCKLTMSREGNSSIVQNVGTQIMGSYSVCQGFDVPLGGLSKGQWNVRVEYNNDTSNGVAEKKIDIV